METTECVTPECRGAPANPGGRLRTLLSKAQPETKPWLHWPATWEEIKDSEEHKVLRGYLTSADVHRRKLEDVRKQFVSAAKEKGLAAKGTVVLLEGGTSDEWMLYSSDCNKSPFRQEAFFQYLVGVNEPDLLAAFFLDTEELLLLLPRSSPDALRFMGPPRSPDFYRTWYSATNAIEVGGVDEVEAELKEGAEGGRIRIRVGIFFRIWRAVQRRGVHTIHALRGVNSDSGRPVQPPKVLSSLSSFKVDDSALYDVVVDCRLRKTPLEAEFLAAACLCSSQGHCFVARHIRPNMVEGQGEALFKAYVGFVGGARHAAYDCICCAGLNASILHYGHAGRPNDATIADGDLLLYDMGGDFAGYATDITFTFPANGVFSETQRAIYTAVLDAQQSVIKSMRPGVQWTDMHRLAERVILKHLKELGIVLGSIEECEAAALGAVFMPHGLGHFMGMDTHDVGGFTPSSPPSDLPGLRYLRTTRVLEKGMCITVEPGGSGEPAALGPGKLACWDMHDVPFCLLNFKLIDKYRHVGGVRLEDDVLVTDDGIRNLTVVPRTVEDVEELMQLSVQSKRLCP